MEVALKALKAARETLRRHLRRGDDEPKEMLGKEVLVVVMSLGSVSCLMWSFIGLLMNSPVYIVSGVAGFVLFFGLCTVILVTKRCSEWMMLLCLLMGTLFTSLADVLLMADFNFRAVGLFILVLDLILVMELPPWATRVLVAYITFHVVFVHMEITFRFGLFDFPGADYEDRHDLCMCDEPPCASGVSWVTFASLVVLASMFLMNFIFVHSFASTMREESAKLAAAIEQAERIASHLAKFDLGAAEVTLGKASAGIPAEMLRALQSLLYNLATYRPYLPQSCIEQSRSRYLDGDGSDSDDSYTESVLGSIAPSVTDDERSDAGDGPGKETARNKDDVGVPDNYEEPASQGKGNNDDVCLEGLAEAATDFDDTNPLAPASATRRVYMGKCGWDVTSNDSTPSGGAKVERFSPVNSGGSSKASLTPVVHKGSHAWDNDLASPSARLRTNHLTNKRISLMTLRATLRITPFSQTQEFIEQHSRFLGCVLKNVVVNKGMIDILMGDKVIGSFNANASRACRFAASGLKAVQSLANDVEIDMPQVKVVGSILGGLGAVGILGTSDMRRPMIFTDLFSVAEKLLGYCAMRGFSWLCNTAIHNETYKDNRFRVVMDTVLLEHVAQARDGGRFARSPAVLYEVLSRATAMQGEACLVGGVPPSKDDPNEWMYEMGQGVGLEWEAYNAAGAAYHEVGAATALMLMDSSVAAGTATAHQRAFIRDAIAKARTVDFDPSMGAAPGQVEGDGEGGGEGTPRGGSAKDAAAEPAGDPPESSNDEKEEEGEGTESEATNSSKQSPPPRDHRNTQCPPPAARDSVGSPAGTVNFDIEI